MNDRGGHAAGDRALRRAAEALVAAAAPYEDAVVGRFGGDEFCVLLPSGSAEDARAVALDAVRRLDAEGGERISCGVAARTDQTARPAELLRAADEAQYRAKRAGQRVDVVMAGEAPDEPQPGRRSGPRLPRRRSRRRARPRAARAARQHQRRVGRGAARPPACAARARGLIAPREWTKAESIPKTLTLRLNRGYLRPCLMARKPTAMLILGALTAAAALAAACRRPGTAPGPRGFEPALRREPGDRSLRAGDQRRGAQRRAQTGGRPVRALARSCACAGRGGRRLGRRGHPASRAAGRRGVRPAQLPLPRPRRRHVPRPSSGGSRIQLRLTRG